MTALTLLTELRAQGVKLWLEGDKLCYAAEKDVVTEDLRQQLAAHKR